MKGRTDNREVVATPHRGVVVVGRASLQNKLLAGLIGERTGYPCVVRSLEDLNGFPATTHALALLDAEGAALDDLTRGLQLLCDAGRYESIAVIDADEGLDLEAVVSCPGVKGLFFRDTSESNLIKGIESIFRGDYWLPRRVLCEHLERTRAVQKPNCSQPTSLTPKEMETLRLLAGGNDTEHIARTLNVSPHTVKTHLYNLFRKINVKNRLQAVHWASLNLQSNGNGRQA